MKIRKIAIFLLTSIIAVLLWIYSPVNQTPRNASVQSPAIQDDQRTKLKESSNYTPPSPLITPPLNIIDDEELEDGDLPDDIESRPLITGVTIPAPTPSTLAQLTSPQPTFTPFIGRADVEPPVAALQELADQADQNEDSDRVRGRRSGGAPPYTATPLISPLPTLGTPEPSPTPRPALPRVSGQARGYVMLPLMHPRARPAIEKQIEILLASQVNDLYISTLVDGTFSEDFAYLESVIRKLNVGSRTLTLEIYLSSGPTMRRWDRTPIETVFSRINPEDFRYLISDDSFIRDEVKRLAMRSRAAFELNSSLGAGNQNLISVMLEDNLDRSSYNTMRSLVKNSIGDSAKFVRNACPGCYKGNDDDPQGDILELHQSEDLAMLNIGDGFTLDGEHVLYPGETSNGISIEDLKIMLELSVANGHRFFGLWRAQRQGLGDQLIHPDDRNYEVATPEQEAIEIDLLRHALIPVISEQPAPGETSIDARFFEFPQK